MEVTQELLHKLFHYEDGKLIWKESQNSKCRAGDVVGYQRPEGYVVTRIKRKQFYVHRLVFLYFHGYLPKFVDHVNHDRSDNRIENLRECTHSQNHANRKHSGNRGLKFRPRFGNWSVRIQFEKKQMWLGVFQTREEAVNAYNKKALELWGPFARLNTL